MSVPAWTSQTGVEDVVLVWGAQGRNTTWHVDKDCRWFTRHTDRPVRIEIGAGHMDTALANDKHTPRYPCLACALPAIVDLAVRGTREHPDQTQRVVLACPKAQLANDGAHRRCPRCADLAAIAARHQTATHVDGHGYRLVYLPVHRRLRYPLSRAYSVHDLPADCPALTSDGLAVAWAASVADGSGGIHSKTKLPALHRDRFHEWHPTVDLNFAAAALVTAPVI